MTMTFVKFTVLVVLALNEALGVPMNGYGGGQNMDHTQAPPPTPGSYLKCADGSAALPGFNGQIKMCTGGNGIDAGYAGCPYGYECVVNSGTSGICCAKGGNSPATPGGTPEIPVGTTAALAGSTPEITVGTTAAPAGTTPEIPTTVSTPAPVETVPTDAPTPPPTAGPEPTTIGNTVPPATGGPQSPPPPPPMSVPAEPNTPPADIASPPPATPPPSSPSNPQNGGGYGNLEGATTPGSDVTGTNTNSSANLPTNEEPGGSSLNSIQTSNVAPEGISFRQGSGPLVPSSGQFTPCLSNSDCFSMREPSEWCQRGDQFVWTDKSCFCAIDGPLQSCVIERFDVISKEVEWTYCAPKTDFKCAA